MQLFLLFSLAHLLGDYPFQTNWIYNQKIKGPLGTLLHVGILGVCFAVVLNYLLTNYAILSSVGIILVIHLIQDYLKIELVSRRKKIAPLLALILDQVLHFMLLAIVAWQLDFDNFKISFGDQLTINEPLLSFILIYCITLILVTFTWDVFKFVGRKEKTLQHDISDIFARLTVTTLVFGVVYLVVFL
ncbi:MAG: DUF3307 domain-containing protein [Patescibacteria group bacterium]